MPMWFQLFLFFSLFLSFLVRCYSNSSMLSNRKSITGEIDEKQLSIHWIEQSTIYFDRHLNGIAFIAKHIVKAILSDGMCILWTLMWCSWGYEKYSVLMLFLLVLLLLFSKYSVQMNKKRERKRETGTIRIVTFQGHTHTYQHKYAV